MADDTATADAPKSTDTSTTTSTPASGNDATNKTPAASTTTPTSTAVTGYIVDSATNTVTVDRDTPFVYKIPFTVNDTSIVTGYLPNGVWIDKTNGNLVGKAMLATATVFTIYTPTVGNFILPLIIKDPLALQFDSYNSTYNSDGSFYSGQPMPAYRALGDSPAISVKAFGGTGNYKFSIVGDAHGTVIDENTGVLSGTLPSTEGECLVTVEVNDGIAVKDITATFNVYKSLPEVGSFFSDNSVKWWEDLASKWSDSLTYEEMFHPLSVFVSSPEADAVPAVKDWAAKVQTAFSKVTDGSIPSEKVQFVAALNLMFTNTTITNGLSVYLIRALPGNVYAVKDAIDKSNSGK